MVEGDNKSQGTGFSGIIRVIDGRVDVEHDGASSVTMNPGSTPEARLRRCGIDLDDVEESFARSSGPGGQNVNKVETLVKLVHRPSGVTVAASEHRSREMNRRTAWVRLAEKFETLREARRLERAAEQSKKRAQANRRSLGLKRRMVETKRRRSESKKLRGKVQDG